MHRVFVSYHHANDQTYKDQLIDLNRVHRIFEDYSVNSGDIDDEYLTDDQIRLRVRDDYLRDSTVTIVLIGLETRKRKHVDWELYSSMRDSPRNRKSGVILVTLPETGMEVAHVGHGEAEKKEIYPEVTGWVSSTRSEYVDRYPFMSDRMIDNISCAQAKVSVVPWSKIAYDPDKISLLVDLAYRDRDSCEYDLTRPMRRKNG